MKKKIILTVLTATACCGMLLTGCGEKVTAESLINGISETMNAENNYIDADLTLDVDASAKFDLLGSDTSMNIGMELDSNIKADDSTSFLDGNVTINMFGMDIEQPLKTYAQKNEDGTVTTYTYDEDSETWTYSTESLENTDMPNMTKSFDASIFSNLELEETDKKSDIYVVNANLSMKDFMNEFDMEELLSDYSESETDISEFEYITYDVKFKFNKSDKKLISIEFSIDEFSTDEMSIEKFELKLNINEYGTKKTVEIPQDVIDNAKEEEDIDMSGFFDEYDDTDGIEDFEYDDTIEDYNFSIEESDDSSL